jgi:hypothetical protein
MNTVVKPIHHETSFRGDRKVFWLLGSFVCLLFASATVAAAPRAFLGGALELPGTNVRCSDQSFGTLGHPTPSVRVDPRTGRQVYAPTGETIDLVLPVVGRRLAPDEAAGARCYPQVPAAHFW